MTHKLYLDQGHAIIDNRTDQEDGKRMYRWAFKHNDILWQIGGTRAINRSQAMFLEGLDADKVALSLKLAAKGDVK